MEVERMGLLRAGERVRIKPADDEGRRNWTATLGGLEKTFPVVCQHDLDVVKVEIQKGPQRGRVVDVPAGIVKKVAGKKH